MGQRDDTPRDEQPPVEARLLRTRDLIDLRLEAPGCTIEPTEGGAELVAGLAATRGQLFAATTDGNLHWRHPYGGDLPWHRYGHAQDVVGMTAIGDRLFVATQQGKLWQRPV